MNPAAARMLKNTEFLGSSQFSPETARKLATAASELQVKTPGKNVAQSTAPAPVSVPDQTMEGKMIALPKEQPVARRIKFKVTTDGAADDIVHLYVLDPKGSGEIIGDYEGIPEFGTAFMGANTAVGIKKFERFTALMCNKVYFFGVVRIRIRPSSGAAAGYVPSLDDVELRIHSFDEKDPKGYFSINPGDHVENHFQRNDFVEITLGGDELRFDAFKFCELIAPKDADIDITLLPVGRQ